MKLINKIIIKAELELLTGLHIGDSKESVEIGGVDSPIVRRKDNNQPYIPGSSLKGKMRALLELATGTNANSDFKTDSYGGSIEGEFIPKLFGAVAKNKVKDENEKDQSNPSRIIVRDSYLTEEWATRLYESEFTDMPYTEIKFENVINRIRGTAENPRQIERVPAGAKFNVEFILNIFEDEKNYQEKYLNLINSAIKLLEDDYLGGSGTRGYGKVKFEKITRNEKMTEEYFNDKN